MSLAITDEEGRAVVHLSDAFDPETAARLGALLETLPPARPVVIDLTFLREGRLTALVAVVGACARRDGVTMRGLSEFGARILGHLGKTKLLRAPPPPRHAQAHPR